MGAQHPADSELKRGLEGQPCHAVLKGPSRRGSRPGPCERQPARGRPAGRAAVSRVRSQSPGAPSPSPASEPSRFETRSGGPAARQGPGERGVAQTPARSPPSPRPALGGPRVTEPGPGVGRPARRGPRRTPWAASGRCWRFCRPPGSGPAWPGAPPWALCCSRPLPQLGGRAAAATGTQLAPGATGTAGDCGPAGRTRGSPWGPRPQAPLRSPGAPFALHTLRPLPAPTLWGPGRRLDPHAPGCLPWKQPGHFYTRTRALLALPFLIT